MQRAVVFVCTRLAPGSPRSHLLLSPIILGLLISGTFVSSEAWALDPYVKQLVELENTANPYNRGKSFSTRPFPLYHYEIPLAALKVCELSSLPQDVRDSLIFEKNGKTFFRWVLQPEDLAGPASRDHTHKAAWESVERWLESQGLDTTRHQLLQGYSTASRSVIVENPGNGAEFSLKASTRWHRGVYLDAPPGKLHHWTEASREFELYRYYEKVLGGTKDLHFSILPEPLVAGIPEINLAISVRSLELLRTQKKLVIPGFVLLDERMGPEIARINGFKSPTDLLLQTYAWEGRATAEKLAKAGTYSDSQHRQNVGFQAGLDLRLDGHVAFRDEGDTGLVPQIAKALGGEAVLQAFPDEPTDSAVIHPYSPHQFNGTPSWLDQKKFYNSPRTEDGYRSTWTATFFSALEQRLHELTGIPLSSIHAKDGYPENRSGLEIYRFTEEESDRARAEDWSTYFKTIGSEGGQGRRAGHAGDAGLK